MEKLTYVTDGKRHLICIPYTLENLHRMAADLKIRKCWFHPKRKHSHYDLPIKRMSEIREQCKVVSTKEILAIMNEAAL